MNDGIISLLKLPGFFVTDVQLQGEEIIIAARKRAKTARCPTCQKRSNRLKDYLRERKVLHMILSRQKIYLVFRKRRFVCFGCGKAFTEQYSFLPPRSHESIFVKEDALEKLSDSSFRKTRERLGFSYGKLVSLLKKVFSLQTIDWEGQLVDGVLRLGIDEHHFGKRNHYLVTIANLLTRKPIHILTKCTKQAVKDFLLSLSQQTKDCVDEVAVDMRDAFIGAVKEALPNARIVIDHFHVIQDANRRVSEARKIEEDVEEKIKGNGPKKIPFKLFTKNKEDLKGNQMRLIRYYQHKYPSLALFYSCKERLRAMYAAGTKQEAEEILTTLIADMKKSEYPELWMWAKTLTKYQPYILNYFDNHTTNAVTEGLHRKFKLIQRQAFGFRNPEVYAYRVMLGCLPLYIFLSKLYPTT